MPSYKELVMWQKAMDMANHVYDLTQVLPEEERYGLTRQIRRAALSVPSNIAEGHARNSTPEYLRFISIAKGSLAETETQLLFCQNRRWIEENALENTLSLCAEINRMLTSTQKTLNQKRAQ